MLHTVPCINPWLFTIFVKSKVSFMRNAFCLVSCAMAAQLHRIANLVTFTDEIPNGKLQRQESSSDLSFDRDNKKKHVKETSQILRK